MYIHTIPCLEDNYAYLLICPKTQIAAIIDTPEAQPIIQAITKHQVKLQYILNTHHHWDHSGANLALLEHFPDLQVIAGVHDAPRIPGITRTVQDGDTIDMGSLQIQALSIAGHTQGHIAYLANDALFCGDTLFLAGCGRLFEGTAEQMYQSLQSIAKLPDSTRIFCGHEYSEKNLQFAQSIEPENHAIAIKRKAVQALRIQGQPSIPSTLEEEKSYNPFLRCHITRIQKKLDTVDNPLTTFTALRKLKDYF